METLYIIRFVSFPGWESTIKRTLFLALALTFFSGLLKADPVSDWNAIANTVFLKALRPGGGAIVDMAYMHIAIYDAVNSIDKRYTVFAVEPTNSIPWASKEAAAISAAYRVLVTFYPEQHAFLDSAYNAKLGEISSGGTKTIGMSIGDEVARKFLKMREGDGRNAKVSYTFGSGPGVYQLTPGAPAPPATPQMPWLAHLKPFTMDSTSQFRAPKPPILISLIYTRDFNEIKQLGSLKNSSRTAQQTETGMFYSENPGNQLSRNLRLIASKQNFTIADNARFFAQVYVSIAEAIIATWDSKYFYNRWRPVTAIRQADTDNNPSTDQDTSWLPLVVTPNHPEYPGAHGAVTGALAYALERFFGTPKLNVTLTSTSVPGVKMVQHSFTDINDLVTEVINARVCGGMHFRTSVEQGAQIAFKVANFVADHKFKPVQTAVSEIPTQGLQLWLRADTGIVINGSKVRRWLDQSGNGNDAIQTDSTRQPLLVNSELNNKPVVRFNGSVDKLGFTGSNKISQLSLFIVFKNDSGATGHVPNCVLTFGSPADMNLGAQYFFITRDPLNTSNPGGSPDRMAIGGNDGNYIRADANNIGAFGQWRNVSIITNSTLFNTHLRWNGNDAKIEKVGVNDARMSFPMGTADGSGGGLGGADGVPDIRLSAKCDIAEVIVFNRVVSDSERTAVEKYLADKYNIHASQPASIPTAHMQLWLKADIGVVMNGPTVSRWLDMSSNGNNAIQIDSTRQPLLINNDLNSKPVIRFDGANDRLGLTGTKRMSKISFFIVQKVEQGATGPHPYYPIVLGDHSQTYGLSMQNAFSKNSPDEIDPFIGTESWVRASTQGCAEFGQWKSISVVADKNMYSTTLRVNGVDAVITPQGGVNAPLNFPLGNSTGTEIGGIGEADGAPDGQLVFKGDIAELIVYDTVLGNSERLAIEQYLTEKYNLGKATVVNDTKTIPARFSLEQNYPNPFNPTTTISYSIPSPEFVSLKVYDILGSEVASLINEEKPSGSYSVEFKAANLSSGIYLYTLKAGNYVQTKKLLLMK